MKIVFLIILPFMLLLIIGVYAPVFAGTPLMAVVDTGDGSVLAELRDKPSENGKVLGTFYNGVELNVMEQHGGWSSVAILGGIRGFIKTEMLCFEDERFSVPRATPIMEVVSINNMLDIEMQSLKGDSIAFFTPGTLAELYGYMDGKLLTRVGGKFGFMQNEVLADTNLPTCSLYDLPSLGCPILDESYESINLYLYPSEKEPEIRAGPVGARVSSNIFASQELKPELLADLGDYLQIRYNTFIDFVPVKFVKAIEKNPPN